MIHFCCDNCQNVLFYENSACLQCGAEIGFDPESRCMVTLGQHSRYQRCRNGSVHQVCNWVVPEGWGDRPLCLLPAQPPDPRSFVSRKRRFLGAHGGGQTPRALHPRGRRPSAVQQGGRAGWPGLRFSVAHARAAGVNGSQPRSHRDQSRGGGRRASRKNADLAGRAVSHAGRPFSP